VACTTPFTTPALGDGPHSLLVTATDGLAHQASATAPFTVDTTGPAVTINSGPKGPTRNTRPAFGFSSRAAGATFACSFDLAPAAPCTSGLRPPGPLPQGRHTFNVHALDGLGNAGAARTRSFKVDTVKPKVSFRKHPASRTSSSKAKFSYKANESGVKFKCKLDRKRTKSCRSKTTLRHLGRGRHKFTVTPTDAAGNRGRAKAFSWRVV
jgi:hypothetical protein